jgi:hypothetical protein
MMATTLDLSGLDRLRARFQRIANPDATPLMVAWEQIIHDDNRRGVMAGVDFQGNPMIPVTYRPKHGPFKTKSEYTKARKLRKEAIRKNLPAGYKQRIGLFQGGTGGNLTTEQYRLLSGPPLAPRGQFSRVITNLQTDHQDGRRHKPWMVWGFWHDVVSRKNVPFLRYHFNGAGRLPRRDLRGIRPWGLLKALTALRNWITGEIRKAA